MIRALLHILGHFAVPAGIAVGLEKWMPGPQKWMSYWLIMSATIIIDVDHLLANPIYDPSRCSLGFHPLHTIWAIGLYVMLLWPQKTRIVAIGLLTHMALDGIDCLMMA